jgi:hypothetical protein
MGKTVMGTIIHITTTIAKHLMLQYNQEFF